jgi:nucleotide-binding universal stress UspA family protein
MLPVKKILATTDFSEPSRQGVKLAVELAEHFRAELLLVHATPPLQAVSGASTVSGYYLPNVSEEIQAEAGAVADRLQAEEIPLQVPSRVHILNGRPADAITTLAGEEGADLIVIASRGASGWKHAVFGSVAERVLRQARCPVLVVTRPD